VLIEELEGLSRRGLEVSQTRLKLSDRAHVITTGHVALDQAIEIAKGQNAIGTTKRGIGPAYTDKAARIGIRAGLMSNPTEFADAVASHLEEKNQLLNRLFDQDYIDIKEERPKYLEYARIIAPFVTNTSAIIHDALSLDKNIIAEGAQGTLLDLDHGTYPFVTSSWPTSAGALGGLGIGPSSVRRVIGVAKAFTSRVGEGPFPCEILGEDGTRLRGTGENPWDEFGTTTGRPRRVGWLDLAILRHSALVNGLTDLAITNLDILSAFAEIPICVGYRLDGKMLRHFPSDLRTLERCQPDYVQLPGWSKDITGARRWSDLPTNAQRYIEFISDTMNLPIRWISVGPDREQVVYS
jgi:adenylosuccinate synthase